MKFLAVALTLTMSFSAFSQQLSFRNTPEKKKNVFRIVRLDTGEQTPIYGPSFAFSKGGTRREVQDSRGKKMGLSQVAMCDSWKQPEPLLSVDAIDLKKDFSISRESCEVLVNCLKKLDREVIVVKLNSTLDLVAQIEFPGECKPLEIE
jgi:hypothetical protein